MEKAVLRTRVEIEQCLERGLVGKMITFPDIRDKQIIGRMQRLSINVSSGKELLIGFQVDTTRYEFDLKYFVENTAVYVDSSRTDNNYVRRLLKGN